MSNSGFINSTVICNERKSVDLDALNLLASGTVTELCQCTYKNEKKHHHFIYHTTDMLPLASLQAGLSFENAVDILAAACDMIRAVRENGLVLDNVKNAKGYVFKADDGYRFVYIPLIHKPHITARDFLLKLLAVIHHRDVRLTQFAKGLRKQKDDQQALAYVNAFAASYNIADHACEAATSLLAQEGETSLLAQEEETSLLNTPNEVPFVRDADRGDAECETSVLSQADPVFGDGQDSMPSEEGETTVLSQSGDSGELDGISTGTVYSEITECFQDASADCETTVLTSQPVLPSQPLNREIESEYFLYLIRNLNGEKITVDVTPFAIGKDAANMDFVLNNDSVSRHHATIIYENGDYFIMDNHSTNGTMIEGIRLQPEEKGEIGNGYMIWLGSESFQAYIERR